MKTHLIYGIIIGLLAAYLGLFSYLFYQLNKQVSVDDLALHQVVDFINQGIAASQKSTPQIPTKQ